MNDSRETEPLWVPSAERVQRAQMTRYVEWLRTSAGLQFDDYESLWRWSTTDLPGFWGSIWTYFDVLAHREPERTIGSAEMPGAEWFPGATLNFAEHALRGQDDRDAIVATDETGATSTLTYGDLRSEVARVAEGLRQLGVESGDRVAAILPHGPEAVIALLATASIGAIWSVCSPEIGARIISQRLGQVRPKVLIAADGYRFGGGLHDRRASLERVRESLPDLAATVLVRRLDEGAGGVADTVEWPDLGGDGPLTFAPVPFDHPLWILYSSGTTGIPKAIVHSHGGVLLEQMKAHALHNDIGREDRYMRFTTTGWTAWNLLVSGLLLQACIVTYEGSQRYPDADSLWERAAALGVTVFGISPAYLESSARNGSNPARDFDLDIRTVITGGSPLLPSTHRWLYERVSPDLFVANISGGTDMCAAVVGSAPVLPAYAGEMQCRILGIDVAAFDADGHEVIDEVGELVVLKPMPSMPIYLWGDEGYARYRETWLDTYPGVWRHGDWVEITSRGTCIIRGRSDATINRGGVRMGSTDFYTVVEALPEIADSLVVDVSVPGGKSQILLFVVLTGTSGLDAELEARINTALREEASPLHVPDEIRAVSKIPRNVTGKKLEVPVKRILGGEPLEEVVSRDLVQDQSSLDVFVEMATPMKKRSKR